MLKSVLGKKGDIDLEVLGKWVIAMAVLVIIFGGYFLLSGKFNSALNFIKNFFRFGG